MRREYGTYLIVIYQHANRMIYARINLYGIVEEFDGCLPNARNHMNLVHSLSYFIVYWDNIYFYQTSENGTKQDANRRMHKLLMTIHRGSKLLLIEASSEIASSKPSLPDRPPMST